MDLDKILFPLEWVVAWLMVSFHAFFTWIGLPSTSGFTWALSIVGLTIVIRIALIPLFVKQIHASRGMQLVQPEMQKIQKKYKGKSDPESRQAMTQETMALYKRTGTNPFASCLPILLQSPVFFALFRVLQSLPRISEGKQPPIGAMTVALAHSAEQSTIFGAKLSSYFLAAPNDATKIVTVVLIILMSASMFTSQRQLMMKNMPANAMDNPFAKQQKVLLYLMPLFFAFSGINFPIGVLIYWTTTNVWSMGQQLIVIRNNPTPGSKAYAERQARLKKAGRLNPDGSVRKTGVLAALTGGNKQSEATAEAVVAETVQVRRQQPRKQTKAQRQHTAAHPGAQATEEHAEEPVAEEPVALSKQDAVPAGRSAAKQPAGKSGQRQQPKRGGQGGGQRPKKKS